MKRLVFVHGRSQEDRDAEELKKIWLDALNEGLAEAHLELPIPETQIHFMYYGDTLRDLCADKQAVAEVIMKGALSSQEDKEQLAMLLEDYLADLDISDQDIQEEMMVATPDAPLERGPQNWAWVQAVIRVIDSKVPGAGALIAIATNDVHQYLTNDKIRGRIEDPITKLMHMGDENVVVSHSLGTIVAYKLLHRWSEGGGWRIPLLVTLGSPLGLKSIRKRLRPISRPSCVGDWYNALDPNDVVALYPLDKDNFNITPGIQNKVDVDNKTPNQHGIVGYLSDKDVAKRIHEALVAQTQG